MASIHCLRQICARFGVSHKRNIVISKTFHENGTSLPQDIQERLVKEEEKAGFLANVFKAFSYRPEELRAFLTFYDTLMEKKSDTLSKAEKEMIIVVTSSYNNCLYCIIAHSALHRIYSKNKFSSDQLAACPESANLSSREKAIVDFAMEICQSKAISDQQIQALVMEGLTMDDVWDVGAITSLFGLSNRMAHMLNMRPNEEFYLMGRVDHKKKEKS